MRMPCRRLLAMAAGATLGLAAVAAGGGPALADGTASPPGDSITAGTAVTVDQGHSTTIPVGIHLASTPPAADVLLAFDTTGSMSAALTQAENAATTFVSQVQTAIPGARFSVAAFQDYPTVANFPAQRMNGIDLTVNNPFMDVGSGDQPWIAPTAFSSTASTVTASITALKLGYGGDLPEAYNRAFYEASRVGWNPAAAKYLVVFGDQVGHDPSITTATSPFKACNSPTGVQTINDPGPDGTHGNADDLTTATALGDLAAAGVTPIFEHYTDGNGGSVPLSCYQALAAAVPGGQAVEATNSSTLGSQIATSILAASAKVHAVSLVPRGADASWVTSAGLPTVDTTTPADLTGITETVAVPHGTAPGTYPVDVDVVADGAVRATQHLVVTVTDAAPEVTVTPTASTLEATGPDGAAVPFSVTAADADDDTSTLTAPTCTTDSGPVASGDTLALGDHTVSCSVTDPSGVTGTGTADVSVVDTTAPTFTAPHDVAAAAFDATGAPVTYSTPTASDAVDGDAVPVSCTPASDSVFALGSTPVTCTATDRAGNTASHTFSVTVTDQTAPVVTVPADQTAEATGPGGATLAGLSASASDAVDGPVPAACTPALDATFAVGTTTVTCTAADDAGNVGSQSFTVTVTDRTAPVVTVPGDLTEVAPVGADSALVTYSGVSASDLVDGSSDTPACDHPSGSSFDVGVTTVTCAATDAHGNTGTAQFTVTVQRPIVITPTATEVYGGAPTPGYAPADAAVTGQLTCSYPPASGVGTLPLPVGSCSGLQPSGPNAGLSAVVYAPGTLTVTPATLTVSPATGLSRAYGAANPAIAPSYSGFVGDDTASVITQQAACTTTATATSGVGSYPTACDPGTARAANYVFVAGSPGSLAVTPATLRVDAVPQTRLWGSAASPATGTLSGFVNGESAATALVTGAAVCTSSVGPYAPIGTYPGALTCAPGTLAAPNYAVVAGSPAALTVAATRVVDGRWTGPLVVPAGQAWLITSTAVVTGPVTVQPGGALDVEGGHITGPVTAGGDAVAPGAFRLCSATLTGPLTVQHVAGPVVLGAPVGSTPACGGSTITGPVTVTGNTGGGSVVGQRITGPLTATSNSGGFTVSGNTVSGPARISGNS